MPNPDENQADNSIASAARSPKRMTWLAAVSFSALMSVSAYPSALAQTAPNDATSADQTSTDQDVVVLGVRGAQRAAVDIKRLAPQIVDSIVAEDIGKLPDNTIADSLQRVPGIQISRSAGQGSAVNIRGMGQVLVTMNGEAFLGGSGIGNAQPDFTDIPPTLFSGVDVFKSPTARQLEGGVSGIIDLKTRRPFDLKQGFTVSGSAEGSYGSRVKEVNKSFSGLAGWHSDRFGLLVAGSYSDETLANISNNTGNSWLASTDAVSGRDLRGDGHVGTANDLRSTDYVYQPAVVGITNRITDRKRYGLNASAQALVSDSLTLTGDVSYTRLEDRDHQVSIQLNSGYAALPVLPGATIDSNGVVSQGSYNLPGFATNSLSRGSTSQALNTNLQLDFKNDGPFKASVRWVHGDARRNMETSEADSKPVTGALIRRGDTAACRLSRNCQVYANPNGLQSATVGIDYSQASPSLNLLTDVTNPNLYSIMSTWGYGEKRRSKSDVFRADGTYEFDDGFLKSLEFGGRYRTRDVTVTNYHYLAPVTVPGLGLLDRPGDLYYYKDPQIGHTGRPEIDGLSVLPLYPYSALGNVVRNFTDFAVAGIPAAGIPAVDPAAMDNVKAFQDSLFPGNARYVDPATSFRVHERTQTLYGQANFGGDLGLEFMGNVGLRVIRTKRSIYSNTTDPNNFIGTGGSYNGVAVNLGTTKTTKDFTRFLPSFNLTVNTAQDQRLRVAISKVVGELNLYDLGAGRVLFYGANGTRRPDLPSDLQLFLGGNSGNPNLQPYQSTNYNVSYEWYFGSGGLLSVAAFLFDVKSFPQTVNNLEKVADQDGVIRDGGIITTTGNGTGGKIKGVEVGYQQQFDFLPGILSGFGANINYTLSDSSSSNVDLFGKTLPVQDNSKHQINVIGFYQKDGIQARLAYNWRSKRYAGLQPVNGSDLNGTKAVDNLAIFSKPVGYLDASLSYDVSPKFTVYAQGTNLTNAHDQQYAQFKNLFYQQTLYERRFTVGIRIRN